METGDTYTKELTSAIDSNADSNEVALSLFVGTYNVNGKKPSGSLSPWLRCDVQPDIYVLGFQELDLTGGALLLGDTSRAPLWEKLILDDLNSMGSYTYSLVQSKQLVGMLLCVLVKEIHLPFVSDFQNTVAGCGLMGKMGNKGGVGIRFQIYDKTLCFVNSHLSAHMENVPRRNQDFHDICRRVIFSDTVGDRYYPIFQHDILVWLGDLNYRIELDGFDVRHKIQEKDYTYLLQYDQLIRQQKQGLAFANFMEAPINFAPTYKYDSGTNTYDSSEKWRIPAWCDRVLWYDESKLKVLWYTRHELLMSDHKPVTAFFSFIANKKQRKAHISSTIKRPIETHAINDTHTCIGNDLHYLARLIQPVREAKDILPPDSPHILSVPKELWRLIDTLSKYPNSKELFTDEGDLEEVQNVIASLDSGGPMPRNCSIHSIAEGLLRFLDGLSEPVIPYKMYQRCVNARSYAVRKQIIDSLEMIHYNVFCYIMAFLRDCVLKSDSNRERIQEIATIFANVLIKSDKPESVDFHLRERTNFIQDFLERHKQ